MDCVFCKIINKEIPSKLVFENEQLVAFNDIKPIAPVHILVVPKLHIESIAHMAASHREMIADVVFGAKEIALEKGLKGYKLVFNVGREAGQSVDHLHLHLLSDMKDPSSRNLDKLG